MKIGIIGKGKMGMDIFNHIFDFDHSIVLVCRKQEDIEKVTATIEKRLRKMKRRGYISDDIYEKKLNDFLVTDDINKLDKCQIIIESINENADDKIEMFRKLEAVIDDECILASNTSSISLEKVFASVKKKDRCMGTHFFYPVKLNNIVEINKGNFTGKEFVSTAVDFFESVGKVSFELEEKSNMILTKMFMNLIAYVYSVYNENYLSIEDIDSLLKEEFLTYGVFEIIDSTGVNIIMTSVRSFINDRYESLYTLFEEKGKKILAEGKNDISSYEEEHPHEFKKCSDEELEVYKKKIILRIESFIINEMAYLAEGSNIDMNKFGEAIKQVFGLSKDLNVIVDQIGKDVIKKCMEDLYEETGNILFKPMDLSVYCA